MLFDLIGIVCVNDGNQKIQIQLRLQNVWKKWGKKSAVQSDEEKKRQISGDNDNQ